ncbi:uncharacterized protein LOC132108389 [Carassius carassius]|uniref:uncharacterized protein LOC132108389 n=1 Tax=Carassius carassius TaxID=217509 RepID=UPI002868B91B|nr:uncharacterized protein LOC132108389 [Carassius carassius]
MATRRRKPPTQDAIEHAVKAHDKTAELEVQYINSFKGRGVFAKARFRKGDFVVEYRGELIDSKESQRRRRTYHNRCGVFMFDFYWQEKTWCVDAAREDGSLGRLVNDDHKHPNCKMKRVITEGKPHLCLFALKDIYEGEEITYDYGGTDWPWRKQEDKQSDATESFEPDIFRTTEQTPQRSSNVKTQEDKQSDATESFEPDIFRTTEQTPQRSSNVKTQEDKQSDATESFEPDIFRTTEQTPQRSSNVKTQEDKQSDATESFEPDIFRTTEQTPQRSSNVKTQEDKQSDATESFEPDIFRTTEQTPQRSSNVKTQEDKQSDATESFEPDIFRTTEQTPQRSSNVKTQEDKQSDATESFEPDIFRTTEQTPQRSSNVKTQEDKQSDATESFEPDIFRTTEQTPQRSSNVKTQEDKQSDATESFEPDIFRTTEQTPQRSSNVKTQCPHDPEPLPSMNKVGMNPSLVDYTDSDESQSPSTNHDQFNSSCQTWCPTSEFELSLTHQDRDYVPRLRRTKSVQMNRKVEFASDELFDLTSGSSGEEYIPHSSEDSSEGTDTSEVIQPVNQKESMLRFPILGKYADVRELNDVSSKQILNRGRSPSRRGGNSGVRRKRQCSSSSRRASYPTTQASSGHSTKRSGDPESVLQNTTADLEKDLPESASSLHTEDVADGSLSISAVCKKENGSRMYNKKQYCLYCREGFIKMARHLERAHKDKPEVAQALSFPKGSKERRMHMEYLRNRGNFAHNVDVLNAGVGNLVPRKQPRKDCQAQNFLHCIHCHGFFTKNVLWRHMMTCKFKPSVPQKPGKTRVQALCAFAVPPPPGVKVEFWKLLNNMVQDEVYSVLKSDFCIMEYGEHLYNRLGYDVGKHEYIRQKLRELGRLLICSRKNTSLKTIKDHIKPANFMQVVESVKLLAGYDSKTHAYRCPSLALKIGHNLTKISMLLESHANLQNDYSAAKDARTFRRVYETRWNELISAASLRTLQESKWNTPLLLPFTKDVQTLHSYLDVQQQDLHSKLSTEVSPQTWAKLAKVILAQVILFNRRRAGEVSKMTLSAYVCQNPSDPHEDVNEALSDLEKKLCQHFSRIEIRGKRGRKVPVLLTPVMKQGLDLLVGTRQECEVPRENVYLFARPSALTCYRGSDCLRHFAKVCGAKSPESLTSTKLRKQTGTLSQVLNLSNTELDQLADFLGHDVRVHRQFYRLPEGTLQLAKISKVLMALDQGRLAEFKGKTLDDINIDPEGTYY